MPACEHLNVAPLEFDGTTDSIFQRFDRDGGEFMEYVHDYGSFPSIPFELMIGEWKRYYRINKPEKIKLNPGSLLRTWRLEKTGVEQQNIVLAPRRQAVGARRLAWLRARANKKAAADQRRAAEVKVPSGSSSSSSSSSSYSDDSGGSASGSSVSSCEP